MESIDGASLASDLSRLSDGTVTVHDLPVYDRQLHEPVRGLLQVTPSQGLVLVEGLHLLRRWGGGLTEGDLWFWVEDLGGADWLYRSIVR